MATTKNQITKMVEHPLEDFLGIPSGSTMVVKEERETTLVTPETYDNKDEEIEGTFQEVYDKAMDGFDRLQDEMDGGDERFKARLGEVSVQHLNVALDAAKQKARLKEHKDKLESKIKNSGPKTVNNNIIVDRNELLRALQNESRIINPEDTDGS